ncbi:Hypothetical predicted protein [Olea europaea subsp. europaea]|uniref:Uncharacterized protein n=1 Tax=Olea europaea subsp. europaea TaxID=158383 RepID=A0A8S0VJ82_OLEEU|nr:Hypothetical predicted protein [Olea europaea subsp. europaea]
MDDIVIEFEVTDPCTPCSLVGQRRSDPNRVHFLIMTNYKPIDAIFIGFRQFLLRSGSLR